MPTNEVLEPRVQDGLDDLAADPLSEKRAQLDAIRTQLVTDRELEQQVLKRAKRALADGRGGSPGAVAASRANVAALDEAIGTIDAAIAEIDAELSQHRTAEERERKMQDAVYHSNREVELDDAYDAARLNLTRLIEHGIAQLVDLRIEIEATQFLFLTTAAPLVPPGPGSAGEVELCAALEARGADLSSVAKNWIESAADVAPWAPFFGLTFVNRHRDPTVRLTDAGPYAAVIDAAVRTERAKRVREAREAPPSHE